MPRKLPWDTGQPATTSKTPAASPPTPRKHQLQETEAERSPRSSRRRHDVRRTPSSSPPPQAPSETPMRSGDKSWIMVEDEFLATAQLFTNHLHHAEYKRLQGLVVEKKNESAEKIERPTTRAATVNVENEVGHANAGIRNRAAGKSQSAKHSTRKTHLESDIKEEVGTVDRDLVRLLNINGSAENKKYVAMQSELAGKIKSNTRAAAGFQRQNLSDVNAGLTRGENMVLSQSRLEPKLKRENENDDEDEDDLDAPIRKSQSANIRAPEVAKSQKHAEIRPPPVRDKPLGHPPDLSDIGSKMRLTENIKHKSAARNNLSSFLSKEETSEPKKPLSFDDLPLPTLGRHLLSRKPMKQTKPKEDETKHVKVNEIPKVLFS